MLEEMKDMLRKIIADDELFDLGAQLMKKSFDALVRAGFSEDQATKVVAGQGVGISSKR